MTEKDARLRDYLAHIRQALSRIDRYIRKLSRDEFLADELVQDAVIRNLEIIGEARRNIDRHAPDFVAANPDLPVQSAYEMRNVLTHAYFEVDLDIVWRTVQIDLPALARKIDEALAALDRRA